MFIEIFVMVICICGICEYLKFNKKVNEFSNIVAVAEGYPIVGVLPMFMNPDNALQVSLTMFNKYKDNILFCGLGYFKLIVLEPKLAQLILTTNLDKTEEYDFLRSWLFEGLLTSKTEKWKKQRTIYSRGFNYNFLKDSISAFNTNAKILVEILLGHTASDSFDIQPFVKNCSLDIICDVVLGTSVKTQVNIENEYVKSVEAMCNLFYARSFTLSRIWPIYPYFSPLLKSSEVKASNVLNEFAKESIRKRRTEFQRKNTLLDLLLNIETSMGDDEICMELNTFIFAGHDTSATTLSFTIYMLGQHQNVQAKVYEEIMNCFGEQGDPTYEQLQTLEYTTMVIKEVLRLYPAVPVFSRRLTEDITFKKQRLSAGLSTYILVYAMHRNPIYFPQPEKFNPERFAPECSLPAYAYLPFANGPRNCIGQKFAMLEIKALLVHILRKFQIFPDKEHRLKLIGSVTLHSKSGMKIKLQPRN